MERPDIVVSQIQSHFKAHAVFSDGDFAMLSEIVCADGFKMSVQASRFHYCHPRETLRSGEYNAWEIGFPSDGDDFLAPYAGSSGDAPTKSVFGWVPTYVVDAIIAKHGGIAALNQ
jgi:hypothetical protein